jgi:hypothetical protein
VDRGTLRLDYEQSLETYRQLADIRFKLLALVPTVSTAGVALLARAAAIPRWEKLGLASVGFLATLGIVLYDQRNTQFYNGAIGRAQELERELGLRPTGGDREGGLFRSRREHPTRRLFGLPFGHDLGLALVYCPVLGAWVFVAVLEGGQTRAGVALLAGAAFAAGCLVQLLWHDGKPERLQAWSRRRAVRRPGFVFAGHDLVTAGRDDGQLLEALRRAPGASAYDANGRLLALERVASGRRPLLRPEARGRRVVLAARPRRARDVAAFREALVTALAKSGQPRAEAELLALGELVERAAELRRD